MQGSSVDVKWIASKKARQIFWFDEIKIYIYAKQKALANW